MVTEYELRSIHDSRMSFYKKAYVIEDDGKKSLRSYQTIVCFIEDGTLYLNGTYSQTTLRHIREFIKQNGFEDGTKDELLKKYPSKEEKTDNDSHLKNTFDSIKLVCAFGDIINTNQKDKNDWKARMIKAGLENKGLIMPNDWNDLSEDVKEDRLNKVLEVLNEVKN